MTESCLSCWGLTNKVAEKTSPGQESLYSVRRNVVRNNWFIEGSDRGRITAVRQNTKQQQQQKENVNPHHRRAFLNSSDDFHVGSNFKKSNVSSASRLLRRRSSSQDDRMYCSSTFFGCSLDEICKPHLPYTLQQMLLTLHQLGPETNGIFRRSANYSKCLQIKLEMESSGSDFSFSNVPVVVTAALLKEFLRSLPDCLLTSRLYRQWIDTADVNEESQRIEHISRLVNNLPPCNQLLLRHLVSVLRHICDNAAVNDMTSYNVATCIGQCMLWPATSLSQTADRQLSSAKKLNYIVQQMIDKADDIFGAESLQLTTDCSPHLPSAGSTNDIQSPINTRPSVCSLRRSASLDNNSPSASEANNRSNHSDRPSTHGRVSLSPIELSRGRKSNSWTDRTDLRFDVVDIEMNRTEGHGRLSDQWQSGEISYSESSQNSSGEDDESVVAGRDGVLKENCHQSAASVPDVQGLDKLEKISDDAEIKSYLKLWEDAWESTDEMTWNLSAVSEETRNADEEFSYVERQEKIVTEVDLSGEECNSARQGKLDDSTTNDNDATEVTDCVDAEADVKMATLPECRQEQLVLDVCQQLSQVSVGGNTGVICGSKVIESCAATAASEVVTDDVQQVSSINSTGSIDGNRMNSESCTERMNSEACTERMNSEACTERMNSEACTERMNSEACTERMNSEACTERIGDIRVVQRRRQSFMTATGSDLFPTCIRSSLHWPTIVEEDFSVDVELNNNNRQAPTANNNNLTQAAIDNSSLPSALTIDSSSRSLLTPASTTPASIESSPPSYAEALLHKTLRRFDLTETERDVVSNDLAKLRYVKLLEKQHRAGQQVAQSTDGRLQLPVTGQTDPASCLSQVDKVDKVDDLLVSDGGQLKPVIVIDSMQPIFNATNFIPTCGSLSVVESNSSLNTFPAPPPYINPATTADRSATPTETEMKANHSKKCHQPEYSLSRHGSRTVALKQLVSESVGPQTIESTDRWGHTNNINDIISSSSNTSVSRATCYSPSIKHTRPNKENIPAIVSSRNSLPKPAVSSSAATSQPVLTTSKSISHHPAFQLSGGKTNPTLYSTRSFPANCNGKLSIAEVKHFTLQNHGWHKDLVQQYNQLSVRDRCQQWQMVMSGNSHQIPAGNDRRSSLTPGQKWQVAASGNNRRHSVGANSHQSALSSE